MKAFEYAETQSFTFFNFGVQQMLRILTAKWTKAFGKGYVISKTKVKQNLLVVVIDYFKEVLLEQFKEKSKKSVPRSNIILF